MEQITAKPSDDFQKRRAAMAKRLTSLGKDNPIVAKAVKAQEPPKEDTKWKEWQIVDELVSAARRQYFDKENCSMGDCVGDLAEALSKLASKKGLDKGNSKVENDDNNEDY
jgi:hypothetical protein